MAAHQLPLLSLLVPIYMVKIMCTWRQTWEVWPVLAVAGGTFAVSQYSFATIHTWPGLHDVVLYPMTDIGGGIFSLVVTAIFLKFWKPKKEWHFTPLAIEPAPEPLEGIDPERRAGVGSKPLPRRILPSEPLGYRNVARAWAPYLIMSVLLLLTGLVRQREAPVKPGPGPVRIFPGLHTNYQIPVPLLDDAGHTRSTASRLEPGRSEARGSALQFSRGSARLARQFFLAAIVSMFLLRMNGQQVGLVFPSNLQADEDSHTDHRLHARAQLRHALCRHGRYAGRRFRFYRRSFTPFFAPLLGWLGVFLTGTDAGSNALFGSLQKITAEQVFNTGVFHNLDLSQAQVGFALHGEQHWRCHG